MRVHSVTLTQKLALLSEHWTPKIIAQLNDYEVKVAKFLGEFVWHKHDDTDELFLCLSGTMRIELRDGGVELREGDLYAVPRGAEHKPVAVQECHVLLIEPRGVVNTGDSDGTLTAPNDAWI